MPVTRNKRPVAATHDSVIVTTPSKKARTVIQSEASTSSPESSSPSPKNDQDKTLDGQGSEASKISQPGLPQANETASRLKNSASEVRVGNLHEGARIGPPSRLSPRKRHSTFLPPSFELDNSNRGFVTATPSTFQGGVSVRDIATAASQGDSSAALLDKLEDCIQNLESRLDGFLAMQTEFREELDSVKKDVSSGQTSKILAKIDSLTGELLDKQLEIKRSKQEADAEISCLNDNVNRLQRDLKDREERCKSLEWQLECVNANFAEPDGHGRDRLATTEGVFGQGFGPFMPNAAQDPYQSPQYSNAHFVRSRPDGGPGHHTNFRARGRAQFQFNQRQMCGFHHGPRRGSYHRPSHFSPKGHYFSSSAPRDDEDRFTRNQHRRSPSGSPAARH